MYEYTAVMHVHTIHSDGSYDVDRIAREGSNAGVDMIFITDHNINMVKELGKEGWYDNVLILSGYELNDENSKNHYLVFDIDSRLDGSQGAREYVQRVLENGGIGFMAHPDERRDHFHEHPPYQWTDTAVEGFTGIEIWNYMSEWMEALRPGRQLINLVFPDRTIKGPTPKVLDLWDEAGRTRRVVAIGSADAHRYRHRMLWFDVSIFPYRMLFRRIRTHFLFPSPLTGDFGTDKQMVYDTLREGRVFVTNFKNGDARGFSFSAVTGAGTVWMGGEAAMSNDLRLNVEIPVPACVKILRNGVPVLTEKLTEKRGSIEFTPISPGTYRVEVTRKEKPWIFSNTIRVVSSDREGE